MSRSLCICTGRLFSLDTWLRMLKTHFQRVVIILKGVGRGSWMAWKSKYGWFFSERPHCGLNIWATDYCVPTPEWWIQDNSGPSLLLPEAQRWRGWPWKSEPKRQQRYPLSLMWKALDINESGVVLCLAFLLANWVCRNNLNSHSHTESPCFLKSHCNNPVLLGAQCLCIANAFVLLGTLFCWCTSRCSCSKFLPLVDHTIIWCFFRGAWRRFGGEEEDHCRVLYFPPSAPTSFCFWSWRQ